MPVWCVLLVYPVHFSMLKWLLSSVLADFHYFPHVFPKAAYFAITGMLLVSVLLRCNSFHFLEYTEKLFCILITHSLRDLVGLFICFFQHFLGMADSHLIYIIYKTDSGTGFKCRA